jgi:hypothetical protein
MHGFILVSGRLKKRTIKMDKKPVLIKWLDSKGLTTEWEYWDELEAIKPSTCMSIGYLIDDNKKYKTLAMTISKGQVFGRITIPACSIVKVKELG